MIIEDSGPAVSSVVREKLMQPFFTTKEVGKGTGLGLSISKGLIEGHGGTLLFSFSGKYTQVIITMPLRQVDQEKKAS